MKLLQNLKKLFGLLCSEAARGDVIILRFFQFRKSRFGSKKRLSDFMNFETKAVLVGGGGGFLIWSGNGL